MDSMETMTPSLHLQPYKSLCELFYNYEDAKKEAESYNKINNYLKAQVLEVDFAIDEMKNFLIDKESK